MALLSTADTQLPRDAHEAGAPSATWRCARCGAIATGTAAAGEHINLHRLQAPGRRTAPREPVSGQPLRPPRVTARGHTYLPRARSRLAVRLRGAELDQMLAEGVEADVLPADPALRQRCEARGRLLVRRSYRRTLATEIEGVMALASDPRAAPASSTVWAVDLQLGEVREASSSLRLIVSALRETRPPRAQGVALASLLLRDGRSPLYRGRAPGELKLAAEATALALTSPIGWLAAL